jgi:Tfp pilus assembly protein PilX
MFMRINMHDTEKQAGFALLISLLVVGVVISVGLSVLDLSIKQVQLSSDAKES